MSKSVFTVALTGPDGAGKSTVGREIEKILPVPAKYIYMGVNLESSNLVLPTTRLLLEIKRAFGRRPDLAGSTASTKSKPRPKSLLIRVLGGLKSSVRLINQVAEEWFRQAVVWYYLRRGFIVLLDRHFYYDYYFHDIVIEGSSRPMTSRIHGFLLKNFYPRPDFVIFLDAPAGVLYARKPEGTLDLLEERRQEYLRLQKQVGNSAVIDVTKPVDVVIKEISDLIIDFYRRQGKTSLGIGEVEKKRA
ncbi:MAG: hypothetical protein P8X95_13270 [Anaerolineales bacterium]|jgi:thymidylate kinase